MISEVEASVVGNRIMTIEGFENFVVASFHKQRSFRNSGHSNEEYEHASSSGSYASEEDSGDEEESLEEKQDMLCMPKNYHSTHSSSNNMGNPLGGTNMDPTMMGFNDSFVTDGDCTEGNLDSDEELEDYQDYDSDKNCEVIGDEEDEEPSVITEDILSFDAMLGKKTVSNVGNVDNASEESSEEEEEEQERARRTARKGGRTAVRSRSSSKHRNASRSTSTARRRRPNRSLSRSSRGSVKHEEVNPPSLMGIGRGGGISTDEDDSEDQDNDIFSVLAVAPVHSSSKSQKREDQRNNNVNRMERRKRRSNSRGRDEKLLASNRKGKTSGAKEHSRRNVRKSNNNTAIGIKHDGNHYLDTSTDSSEKLDDGSSPYMTQSMPAGGHGRLMDTSSCHNDDSGGGMAHRHLRRDSSRRSGGALMTDASCPVVASGKSNQLQITRDSSRRGMMAASENASRRRLSVSDRRGRNSTRNVMAARIGGDEEEEDDEENCQQHQQRDRRSLSRTRDGLLRRASSRQGSASGNTLMAQSDMAAGTSSRRASSTGMSNSVQLGAYRRSNSHSTAAIEALAANPYSRSSSMVPSGNMGIPRRPSLAGPEKDSFIYNRSSSARGMVNPGLTAPASRGSSSLTVAALATPPSHRVKRRPSKGGVPGGQGATSPLKRDMDLQRKPSSSALGNTHSHESSGSLRSIESSEQTSGLRPVRSQNRRAISIGRMEHKNRANDFRVNDFYSDDEDEEDPLNFDSPLGGAMINGGSSRHLATMGKSSVMSRRKSAFLQSMEGKPSKAKLSRSRSAPTEELHRRMAVDQGPTMAEVDIDDDTVAANENIHGDGETHTKKSRRPMASRKPKSGSFKLQKEKSRRIDGDVKIKSAQDKTEEQEVDNGVPQRRSSPKSVLETGSSPIKEKSTKDPPVGAMLPQPSVTKMLKF